MRDPLGRERYRYNTRHDCTRALLRCLVPLLTAWAHRLERGDGSKVEF